jgi:hypothetical protein
VRCLIWYRHPAQFGGRAGYEIRVADSDGPVAGQVLSPGSVAWFRGMGKFGKANMIKK